MYNQLDFLKDKQIMDIKARINTIPNKISIFSVLFFIFASIYAVTGEMGYITFVNWRMLLLKKEDRTKFAATKNMYKNTVVLAFSLLMGIILDKFTQSGLIVPARIDVANSKTFLDNKSPQNSKEFLEILNNANPTPVTLNFKEITDTMKTKNEVLFNK